LEKLLLHKLAAQTYKDESQKRMTDELLLLLLSLL
jgi:hypothetical protein